MNLLTMKHVTKSYTDRLLFDDIDFSINEGEKIGIIGVNGTGKSTLLKVIAGIEETDTSEVIKGNKVFINYLSQNPVFEAGLTIYDYVIKENTTEENQWSIEGDAKAILNRLGFADYSEKIDHLSGGQKKKVALAGALLSNCDILILDEPTNHLDNDMTEWLETYLKEYRGALVMVTHDRYFLDLVCNRIVEIDKGKLYSYDTNYEGYLELKSQREQMAYATQKKHENILRKEIAWMQRGARARSTKQKAHIARYEALKNEEKIKEDDNVEILALSSRLGKKTIELTNISKSFGDKKLIRDFTYIFLKNDRIGIVGPNGCGKTTLLKMITGLEPYDNGSIEIGETVKIGYFSQESETLNGKQKVIDYVKDTAEYIQTSEGTVTASQMLERFLFTGALQYSLIEKLSGGEKRRLYLLKVLMEAPNVLILDEPTNDLDIQTLQILEDYLDTFAGIVIAVSHDRYFLDRVARRLFAFEEGSIRQYESSYTEYYLEQKEQQVSDSETKKESKKDASDSKSWKVRPERLKMSYQEQRDYESIEGEITKLETALAEYEEKIAQSARDFVRLNQLVQEKEELEKDLEEKMERFFYLEELAEQIKNQK